MRIDEISAVILLALRLALGAALYAFIGWAFWLMWREFRAQARMASSRQVPRLTLLQAGPEGELSQAFEYTPVTVGRDPVCECQVDDRTVSNRHAQLAFHHNQWWLEDLDSTNGTLLNGQPVTEAVVLINGDQVQCGQVSLIVAIELESDGLSAGVARGRGND